MSNPNDPNDPDSNAGLHYLGAASNLFVGLAHFFSGGDGEEGEDEVPEARRRRYNRRPRAAAVKKGSCCRAKRPTSGAGSGGDGE